MFSDLTFAFRSLRKRPGFTAVAVLTLAVAIGACVTLFCILQSPVLRPLPYPDARSLVGIWSISREHHIEKPVISLMKSDLLRQRKDVFTAIALYVEDDFTLAGAGGPDTVSGLQTSANFLPVLGIKPALGRQFSAEDDRKGAPDVAIISDRLWRTRFGADPRVLGTVFPVNGTPRYIVGVLPARTGIALNRKDILLPQVTERDFGLPEARLILPVYRTIARLAPGVTPDRANPQLERLAREFGSAYPSYPETSATNSVQTLKQQMLGSTGRMFWILAIVVAAVLLVACANVANLFLVRISASREDIAVRLSMGAGRLRIVRQFLAESAVFSLAGSVLGIVFAWAAVRVVIAMAGERLAWSHEIAVDAAAFVFAAGISAFCALSVSAYPAWQISRMDSQAALKTAGRASVGGRSGGLFRDVLVVVQILLSVVLLSCAGLLVFSLHNLQKADPGFGIEGRAFGHVRLPVERYPSFDRSHEFFRKLEQALAAAPELSAAGAVAGLPLSGGMPALPYAIYGRPLSALNRRPKAVIAFVTPGYFEAIGIRLHAGRMFSDRDRLGTRPAVIVNRTFAGKLFPQGKALGAELIIGDTPETGRAEIVGIIDDVSSAGLALPPRDELYIPYAQLPINFATMTLVGRARPGLQASAVAPVLQRVLSGVDSTMYLANAQTLEQLVSDSIGVERLTATLLAWFSGIAVFLAAVGLYSLMSYSVVQRTGEIGIRMALGAQPGKVIALILSQGLRLVVIGLATGLIAAAGTTQLVKSLLYQVEPLDLRIMVGVAVLFVAVAVLACLIPSLRASRIDPLTALRAE